jgi:DedD protein
VRTPRQFLLDFDFVSAFAAQELANVDLRNLDQIQEQDQPGSGSSLATWLLGALGAGALVLTAVVSMPAKHVAAESKEDPLSALIAKSKTTQPEAPPADQLGRDNASFAQLLSDKEPPSTALVAVKARDGRLVEAPERQLPATPPPGDDLPVVPLPAGKLLESTRLTTEPPDGLTGLARDRAQVPRGGERASEGSAGDFQIQVASFRDKPEADAYVEQLRLRGHRAHAESARVPSRGLWYRVRIGPFKEKAKALAYKAEFEAKEGMAAFLVDPEKAENPDIHAVRPSAHIKKPQH